MDEETSPWKSNGCSDDIFFYCAIYIAVILFAQKKKNAVLCIHTAIEKRIIIGITKAEENVYSSPNRCAI